jgi:hypothetical protein
LGQQLSAPFAGLFQGLLGNIEGFFGGLDPFVLFLQTFLQNGEVSEFTLEEDGRRGTGIGGGHVNLRGA